MLNAKLQTEDDLPPSVGIAIAPLFFPDRQGRLFSIGSVPKNEGNRR